MFTTLCMVTIAPDRRAISVRRAGHPAPLLVSGDAIGPLEGDALGPPLGVLDDVRWSAAGHALPEEWSLLLYTDGLIEGRTGPGPQRLGDDGLVEMVRGELRRDGADRLAATLVERAEELNGGPMLDDVAAVLVQRRVPAEAAGCGRSQWFALAVGVLVFVGVVGTVASVIALGRLSSARTALADRLDPASIEAETLLAAMVDQETGVRGYALVGRGRYLEPYRSGRPATAAALARLQSLDVPEIRGDVRGVAATARAWESRYAVPAIAQVKSDPAAARQPTAVSAGKDRFDAFRAAVRTLEAHLRRRRVQARARLDDSAQTTLLWVLARHRRPAQRGRGRVAAAPGDRRCRSAGSPRACAAWPAATSSIASRARRAARGGGAGGGRRARCAAGS